MASMNSSNFARSDALRSRGFLFRRVISMSILCAMVNVACRVSKMSVDCKIMHQGGGLLMEGFGGKF